MSGSDLDAGEGANTFSLEGGEIGSLICFDSIYDGLIRESVRGGAQLLCLSTNDSWFASSRALNMHLAQAQLRAVESGRWVVRSANTGITSAINSRGEIVDSIPILEEGVLVCEAAYEEEMTLYTGIGNLFVYGWIALISLVTVWEFSLWICQKISKTT
jgi:apolipoprotein N-acyltransferase